MSKIALGTVQFGLDYGVSNLSGQVAINDVKKILDVARDNGINTLDTAPGYGNSEKVLGKVGISDYQIVTKTISLNDDADKVIDGFHKSLKNLNTDQVKGLLIHNIDDIKNKQFTILFSKLNRLKEEGLINKIGFSTYTPEQVNFLLVNFDFDLIQLPFNVFDARLTEGGQLTALKNQGVEIHARSVFLQGVLLNFDNLSDYFLTWQKQFEDYQKIVKESGQSLLEYALNFALNTQELDEILVGVDNVNQLTDIVSASKLDTSLKAFSINDINLLNPSLWK